MVSERDEEGCLRAFADVVAAAILVFAGVIVLTRMLDVHPSSLLVLAHAALPIVLLPVWFAAAITGWRGHPIRFALAVMLCISYGFAVAPAVHRRPVPLFASTAPAARTLRVFMSNVYVDNEASFGSDLPLSGPGAADVLVFVEFATPIEAGLRRDGWFDDYPFRADNGEDGTNRIVVYSRLPFAGDAQVLPVSDANGLGCALVLVDVKLRGGETVRVIGAHPRPLTVSGAGLAFVNTVRLLQDEVLRARSATNSLGGIPLVVAGDFNGTRWLPTTGQLFDNGVADTHEALGYGLSASWPRDLSPLRPFMRLDHAFFSGPIAPTALRDVSVRGSDHVGFLATYGVAEQRSP